MRTLFYDSVFKCHTSNPDGIYTEFQTDFFDGKCDAFIEGYRFIPEGESWAREYGVVFTGEMVTPWKDYAELDAAQRQYEQALIAEYAEALRTVGVTV